jgi:DNA-binding phage protein
MSRKASVSHDEWMIEELRRDKNFAAEYLAQAMAEVAKEAGIQRESLYRALSPNDNSF